MIIQKMENFGFQEPTLRRESTVRREKNLSGESHGDREEFQPEEPEDDAEAQKDFWPVQGYFFYCHQIEPRVQLTCPEKNHSLFHKIYIIERNSSEKKYTMRSEDWRKAKTSEAKTNSIVLILQGRTEFCTLLQLCARIRSDEKILRKLFTSFPLKTLSRLAAQRVCETKFFK